MRRRRSRVHLAIVVAAVLAQSACGSEAPPEEAPVPVSDPSTLPVPAPPEEDPPLPAPDYEPREEATQSLTR